MSFSSSESSSKAVDHISEILPSFLYIGDFTSITNLEVLKLYRIDEIISCVDGGNSHIKQTKMVSRDRSFENISRHFLRVKTNCQRCLREKKRLLISCRMGVSRSSTLVLSFLIDQVIHGEEANLPTFSKFLENENVNRKDPIQLVDACIKFVRQKRPVIKPNDGFKIQLRDLVREYKGLKTNFTSYRKSRISRLEKKRKTQNRIQKRKKVPRMTSEDRIVSLTGMIRKRFLKKKYIRGKFIRKKTEKKEEESDESEEETNETEDDDEYYFTGDNVKVVNSFFSGLRTVNDQPRVDVVTLSCLISDLHYKSPSEFRKTLNEIAYFFFVFFKKRPNRHEVPTVEEMVDELFCRLLCEPVSELGFYEMYENELPNQFITSILSARFSTTSCFMVAVKPECIEFRLHEDNILVMSFKKPNSLCVRGYFERLPNVRFLSQKKTEREVREEGEKIRKLIEGGKMNLGTRFRNDELSEVVFPGSVIFHSGKNMKNKNDIVVVVGMECGLNESDSMKDGSEYGRFVHFPDKRIKKVFEEKLGYEYVDV